LRHSVNSLNALGWVMNCDRQTDSAMEKCVRIGRITCTARSIWE